MNKEKIIESLKHSNIPDEIERAMIFELLENKSILEYNTIDIVDIFNYGKLCGIRKERLRKVKKI